MDPLILSRTSAGFNLRIDPSYAEEAQGFSLAISALLNEPLVPNGDTVLPLAVRSAVLIRETSATILNFAIRGVDLEASLAGTRADLYGLAFTVNEIQAGQDSTIVFSEEVTYIFPALNVSLDSKAGDPQWGDDLLASCEWFSGTSVDSALGLAARVLAKDTKLMQGTEIPLALSTQAIRWDPALQSYRIDGTALQAALAALPRGLDQLVELKVFIDIDMNRSLGMLEPRTAFEMPPSFISFSPESLEVEEGSLATFLLSSSGLPAGTPIQYLVSGDGITEADFVTKPLSGIFSLASDGKAVLQLQTSDDQREEGDEVARVSLMGQDITGELVISDPSTIRVGTDEADFIRGTHLDDYLEGGKGNDTLEGRAGSDVLDGGEGVDTAIYQGVRNAYRIASNPDGSTSVALSVQSATNLSPAPAEESDTLTNIELLQFSDTAVNLALPLIELLSSRASLKAGDTAMITFTLSEGSADFGIQDVTVTGGTLSNFTGAGTAYSAIFTPTANSTQSGIVSVASETFSNATGSFNADGSDANNTVLLTVDTRPLTTTAQASGVFLPAGSAVALASALVNTFGSSGEEIVVLGAAASRVVADQNIERVHFSEASSAYRFQQTGNQLNVYPATGDERILNVALQPDADGTVLVFQNGTGSARLAAGVMSLGGATVNPAGPTAISPTLSARLDVPTAESTARAFLGRDASFTAASAGLKVYGSSGTESLVMGQGIRQVEADQNVETVEFGAMLSDYTFQQRGNQLAIHRSSDSAQLLRIPVQGDSDGTLVHFGEAEYSAKLTAGVMRLGTWVVSSTAPGSLPPVATAADNGTGVGPAITVAGLRTAFDHPLDVFDSSM